MPEQVQDFYPTPSTISTCMYYTGVDPRTMKPVYVPHDPHEKAMQRALIQYRDPKLRDLVEEALRKAGRTDLIGNGPECLLRLDGGWNRNQVHSAHNQKSSNHGFKSNQELKSGRTSKAGRGAEANHDSRFESRRAEQARSNRQYPKGTPKAGRSGSKPSGRRGR